jgi:kynureninase
MSERDLADGRELASKIMDRFDDSLAKQLDLQDPLAPFRNEFYLPSGTIYLDGNSLGPLSRAAEAALKESLETWREQAIGGWLEANPPWFDLAEHLATLLAPLIGADPTEVILANSTTVNLHQLLSTFYAPCPGRDGILLDELAFPTDRYAVDSHLRLRGQQVERCRRLVPSRDGRTLTESDIVESLDESVQVAILPSVIYTIGQLLDIPALVSAAHRHGVLIGFDCSHSVGVVPHQLSEWGVDFAFFCTYKYLNGGPGSPAAIFVHRRHHGRLPGMAGWFGNQKETQFEMASVFTPAPGAGAFQMGTPSILSMAPLVGSLSLIRDAGINAIRTKSQQLTAHLRQWLLDQCRNQTFSFADPDDPKQRGGHVALVHHDAGLISRALRREGVIVDFRPPDIVRLAPAPLYTSFAECWNAAEIVGRLLHSNAYRSDLIGPDRIP